MISGKPMTTDEYRKIDRLSASDLRLFVTDRRAFFKKNVEKQQEEEEYNRALLIGDIVHTLILEEDNFNTKYFMSICPEPPTGLMLKFVETLYKLTLLATDEEGNVTVDFKDIAKEAYKEAGFKWTFETVIEKFRGSNAELYYTELREAKTFNKKIVCLEDIDLAKKIVQTLKTHDFTREIVNLQSDENTIVLKEQKVEFELYDIEMKAMLDKIVIRLDTKEVFIYDYKIVWDNIKFYKEYYLYRRADIQGFVYYKACKALIEKDETLKSLNLEVRPPIFITADSTNFYCPILFEMSYDDLSNANIGFSLNDKYYHGVSQILKEIVIHKEKGNWSEPLSLQKQNGVVPIKHIF
jgi:hypothetical protein